MLWAPWRGAYVSGPKSSGCIFCAAREAAQPREHLLLANQPALVMLNKYPYASAHLMVAPRRHTADLAGMPAEEFQTLMGVLQSAAAILGEAYAPSGLNIGLNLGSAAGAGVADHLHWHVVPRWIGDTNFMPLLAETRVMPEHLDATFEKLQPLFARLDHK